MRALALTHSLFLKRDAQHVSSDTQFHPLRRHPDLRTPRPMARLDTPLAANVLIVIPTSSLLIRQPTPVNAAHRHSEPPGAAQKWSSS